MDGARLWESTHYYDKSEAQIAALFDSVYVSFYKGLGGIGGASAAVWAATQVWPMITSAVPGAGGVVCAILASVAMCSAGCGVGATATACGCCIVGCLTEGSYALFSSEPERESLREESGAKYSSVV